MSGGRLTVGDPVQAHPGSVAVVVAVGAGQALIRLLASLARLERRDLQAAVRQLP